ncbi:MAG: PilZ domain-containing protein [Terriglobia bacterium]
MTEPKVDWTEKRSSKRITVSLPLLVRGVDKQGSSFEDTTNSYNVSRDGASFSTRRELEMGQFVDVVIPRRQLGRPTGDFETKGEVVRVRPKGEAEWEVGLHFVGPRLRIYIPEST